MGLTIFKSRQINTENIGNFINGKFHKKTQILSKEFDLKPLYKKVNLRNLNK